jgi:hypothetical protein
MRHATFANDRKLFHVYNLFLFWEAAFFILKFLLPSLTMRTMNRGYRQTGYTATGFGYYTNVLRRDGEVLKIFEFSAKCRESEREALVKSLKQRLELAQQYLGGHLVSTIPTIESHPITGHRCVVIRQPYIKGRLLMKQPYTQSLNPKLRSELSELFNSALKLYRDRNYLLDINRGNLVVSEDKILILDTILMGKADVVVFPKTLRMLKKEVRHLS